MKNKGNGLALIPLGVFLLVYLGTSIVAKDFYAVSVIVPFLAAALTALIMNRKIKFDEKVEIFCKGAGNTNILLMIIIFILAGAFAQVAKDMGAVDSTVNLGLSLLPSSLLIPGIFVIGCFIALSIGVYKIDDPNLPLVSIQDRANVARKNNKGNIGNHPLYTCVFYSDLERLKMIKEKEMENRMEEALNNNEFIVYLQPKIASKIILL